MSDLSTTLPLVRAAVDDRLQHLLTQRTEELAESGTAAQELLGAAGDLLRGGKRMRAVLAALGLSLASSGQERSETLSGPVASHLGASLELYQASALVHDDVIDAALTRRGLPAAHRHFTSLHRERAWLGQPETFGQSAAILLGDLLLSTAGQEMGSAVAASTAPESAQHSARNAFDAMTAEVAVGQYLDVHSEVLPLPDAKEDPHPAAEAIRERALAVVRRKSARYSVMYPLLIGALLSGVSTDSPAYASLARFGEETGIAFQLRDDALGVFGDPTVTGKPAGDDLREGKRTVLLALAWSRTDDAGRRLLRHVLANPLVQDTEIEAATALMRACGAPQALEEEIASHLGRAVSALEDLGESVLSQESRSELLAAARLLTARDA